MARIEATTATTMQIVVVQKGTIRTNYGFRYPRRGLAVGVSVFVIPWFAF